MTEEKSLNGSLGGRDNASTTDIVGTGGKGKKTAAEDIQGVSAYKMPSHVFVSRPPPEAERIGEKSFCGN